MSTPTEATSHALDTPEKIFRRNLSSYVILDIGILEAVTKTEKGIFGIIRSSRMTSDGSITRYTNVELLSLGSSRGGFSFGGDAEDLYLIFSTASPLLSSLSRKVDPSPDGYSSGIMKGIPIASALQWIGNAGFDKSGNFYIKFPDSTLTFNIDSSVSYMHSDILKFGKNKDGSAYFNYFGGRYQFFLMADGSWYKSEWSADGHIYEMMIHDVDGTAVCRRWSTAIPSTAQKGDLPNFTDFLYEEVIAPDGSTSISYKNSSNQVIGQESVSAAGARTLTGTSLDMISIAVGGTEKFRIAVTDKMSVNNATQDLYDLINELFDKITSISTVGSSSAQSISPASIAQFEALRIKYNALIKTS